MEEDTAAPLSPARSKIKSTISAFLAREPGFPPSAVAMVVNSSRSFSSSTSRCSSVESIFRHLCVFRALRPVGVSRAGSTWDGLSLDGVSPNHGRIASHTQNSPGTGGSSAGSSDPPDDDSTVPNGRQRPQPPSVVPAMTAIRRLVVWMTVQLTGAAEGSPG